MFNLMAAKLREVQQLLALEERRTLTQTIKLKKRGLIAVSTSVVAIGFGVLYVSEKLK